MSSKMKFWSISLLVLATVAALFVLPYPNNPPIKEQKPLEKSRSVLDYGSGYIPKLTIDPPLVSENKKDYQVLELTEDNTVEFLKEVSETTMNKLIADLNKKQNKTDVIYLLIDSPGGDVFAGVRAMQVISGFKVPIYTVCISLCASMGAHLHALGVKRYMTTQAVLMYHPPSGGIEGDFKLITSRLIFLSKFFAKMDLYIANKAGIPYEEFQKRLRDEYWLNAEDATFEHFNDDIVILDDTRASKDLPDVSPFVLLPQESTPLSSGKFFNFK